jgi:hypothetical protein
MIGRERYATYDGRVLESIDGLARVGVPDLPVSCQ